jgi:hypothetical protein
VHKSGFIRPGKGSIPMLDRPRDRSSHRNHQDAPPRSARSHHVEEWKHLRDQQNSLTDQQASTSSGLDKGKQIVSEDREHGQNNDILLKRFKVCLAECRIYQKDTLKKDNKEFDNIESEMLEIFEKLNPSEKEEFVEMREREYRQRQPEKYGTPEQLEIDKKLGYLLKDREEQWIDIRMAVLEFMEKKIAGDFDAKREIFHNWGVEIDQYCRNHKNMNESFFNYIMKGLRFCNETSTANARDHFSKNAGYNNEQLCDKIISINTSLYTDQERAQLLGQQERERRQQHLQDLEVQQLEHDIQPIRQEREIGNNQRRRFNPSRMLARAVLWLSTYTETTANTQAGDPWRTI